MPLAKLSHAILHYRCDGPAFAPVVVFSNSLGTDLGMWDAQVEALSSHFRVLRYDTRGHGSSSGPRGPYTLDELGRDVVELLDALEIRQAHLGGISLGGMTVLWMAIHAPERVLSIAAGNTAARIGTALGWDQRIQHVKAEGMSNIAEATMERWFTAGFRHRDPETVERARRVLCATDVAGYIACCGALRDADLTAGLARIAVPTLIFSATHDPVTPPSDGHRLQQGIAGAIYRELPAAHLSNIEDAAGYNAALLAFLALKDSCRQYVDNSLRQRI